MQQVTHMRTKLELWMMRNDVTTNRLWRLMKELRPGVSRTTVENIVKGRSVPRPSTAQDISAITGGYLTPDDVLRHVIETRGRGGA